MNRFASGPWKHGFGFRPPVNIDSAPQSFVTVCMIFSCSPESCGQAPSDSSAADPFPFGSCLTLPDRTDEHRASISSDSLCRYPIIPFPGCQPETPQASIFCYIRQDSQSEMLFFGDSVQVLCRFYDSFSNSRLTFFYNNSNITSVGFASVHQSYRNEVYKWIVFFMTVISIFCGKN